MFQPAVKERLKARVALAGAAGAGKTFTALRIATGLAQGGRIALIDTERRSASLYADEFTFDTLDFKPPYRPDGLIDAIREAEKAGYVALIIDSLTHFWSGPGGILDVVERNKKGNSSFSGWAAGTPLQQKVVDTMLTANLHVIACMRSKQEWSLEEDARGRKTPTRIGMGVQQRGDIEYEFTVFGELSLSHVLTISKSRCKTLADRVEPSPGEALAEELLAWLDNGAVVERPAPEPVVEQLPAPDLPAPSAPVDDPRASGGNMERAEPRPRVATPEVDPAASLITQAQQLREGDPAREVNGAIGRLDDEHAAILNARLAKSGIDADDVEAVGKITAQLEKQQKSAYMTRQRGANAAMSKLGITDDDARHQFVSDATSGATTSTGALTDAQYKQVIEATK